MADHADPATTRKAIDRALAVGRKAPPIGADPSTLKGLMDALARILDEMDRSEPHTLYAVGLARLLSEYDEILNSDFGRAVLAVIGVLADDPGALNRVRPSHVTLRDAD